MSTFTYKNDSFQKYAPEFVTEFDAVKKGMGV
jgi:hypothetical protein